jgi:hypothetical protein
MSEDYPLYGFNLHFELPDHPEFTDAIEYVEIDYNRQQIHMTITEDRGGKILRTLLGLRQNYYNRLSGNPHNFVYWEAKVLADEKGTVLRTMRFTDIGIEKLKAKYTKNFAFGLVTDNGVKLEVTFPYVVLQFLA